MAIDAQVPAAPPRIAPRPDDTLGPPELVAAIRQRRGGSLLNLDRMLLNSPAYAQAWNQFLGAVRSALSLPARLRELAICAVAVLNRADYELAQHAPEFLQAGGLPQQLARLQDYAAALVDTTCFDAAERAVLALAQEMTLQVQVSDARFAQLRQALPSQQQQVELVGVIAAYNMVSRFLEALQVAPESSPANRTACEAGGR